jgi:hypothetical protein
MWKKSLKLMIGFVCGYLYIKLIFIHPPFSVSEFFIGLIMSPLRFFLAVLMFFSGFVLIAKFIKETLQHTRRERQEKRHWNNELFFEFTSLILIFLFLFQIDRVHTLIFFSFSLMYGMISMDI